MAPKIRRGKQNGSQEVFMALENRRKNKTGRHDPFMTTKIKGKMAKRIIIRH